MLTLLASVATVTGVISSTLPALQIRKMIRDRSAGGVSVPYLLGSFTNGAIWSAYGLALGNRAIVASNGLWLAMCSTMIATAVTLNRRPQVAPAYLVAKAVVDDPHFAAEFRALVDEHTADKLSTADTLIMRPGAGPALTAA